MLPVLRGICRAAVVVLSVMTLPLVAQEATGVAVEEGSAPPVPAATGQVYRTVDAQGRVVFTDAPPAGRQAEEVRIHNTNTVPMARSTAVIDSSTTGAVTYEHFEISSPVNDTVLGQDANDVALVAEISPGLQEGHTVQFFYDGQPVGQRSTELTYVVNGLERGTHTAQARVFDSKDVELLATGTVQFHVRRISTLNKVSAAGKKSKDDEKKGWLRQLWGRGATAPTDMEPVGGYGAPKDVGSLAGAGKPGGAGNPQAVGSLGPK